MSTGEYERPGPEGRERVVERYYLVLDSNRNTELDFRGYTEDLLIEAELGLTQDEIDFYVNAAFFGMNWATMTEREIRDRMMLVPFDTIGPIVDNRLKVEEATAWYQKSLNNVARMTKSVHTNKCFEFDHGESCEFSRMCPKIQIRKYLEQPALYAFDEVYEEIRGTVSDSYELALAKEDLVVRAGYRTKDEGLKIMAEYRNRKQAHVAKIGRQAILPTRSIDQEEPVEPENS